MSRTEQLEWEARWAPWAAAAAILAVLLPFAAIVVQSSSLDQRPTADETRVLLELYDRQGSVFLSSAIIQGIGLVLVGPVLAYLFRAVKFRRPSLPSPTLGLALLGPLLIGVAGIVLVLDQMDNADQFLGSGPRTEARADDIIAERSGLTVGLGLAGAVALAYATIQVSLSAMRAGLVSRFVGIIGIIVGALHLLGVLAPVFAPQIIQIFWLGALAILFLDRWPGGRGPAWASGTEEPWPSAADQARAREQERAEKEAEPPSEPRARRKKRS